jgi:hypothetical protein
VASLTTIETVGGLVMSTLSWLNNNESSYPTPDAFIKAADDVSSVANQAELDAFIKLLWQKGADKTRFKPFMTPILAFANANKGGNCAFDHMDRRVIALQLVTRVIDPMRIQQKNHPLCGPLVVVQTVAYRKPTEYVDYVTGLAEHREGFLGIYRVKIKKGSNLLKKTVNHLATQSPMQEADYIAIGSLRESTALLPYRSALTNTVLQGWTFPGQVKSWMESMGYNDVHDRTMNKLNSLLAKGLAAEQIYKHHIALAKTEISQGRVVFLYTAGQLTEHQLNKPVSKDFADRFTGNYVGGHWSICRGVDISDLSGVVFSLDSWGQSSDITGKTASPPLSVLNWSKVTSWYRGYVSGSPW